MSGTFKGKIAGEQKRKGDFEMAMYENEGYCPNNSFMTFSYTNSMQRSVLEILGDRPGYMVYDRWDRYWSCNMQDSIVDALLCGDSVLGVQAATCLELMIPACQYGQEGRKIIIHDIINPAKADADILYFNDTKEWMFSVNGGVDRSLKPTSKSDKHSVKKLYWDDRYLVCIEDPGGNQPIHIFLMRTASSDVYAIPSPDVQHSPDPDFDGAYLRDLRDVLPPPQLG